PMLAPPTIATLPFSPRSISRRVLETGFGQEPLRVLVENFVEYLRRVAFRAPVLDEPLVGEQRVVAAEQDAVLQAPGNLVFEVGRVVLRRPAVQLVPDVALVHEHGDHLGLPRPAGTRGDNLEVGVVRRDPIEMPRVAIVEDDAVAAWQARAEPRGADEDEHGNAGLDAQVVVRLIGRIARRRRQRGGDGVAEEADLLVDAAAKLADAAGARSLRIDVYPVAEDDVAMRRLRLEGIVVQRAHLIERPVFGVTQVEDRAHTAGAEVGGHLSLGVVARLRIPGGALLGQLLLRLQRIAAPRPPVRMDVDDFHAIWLTRSKEPLNSTVGARRQRSGRDQLIHPSPSRVNDT